MTTEILTSLHGNEVGLSASNELVIRSNRIRSQSGDPIIFEDGIAPSFGGGPILGKRVGAIGDSQTSQSFTSSATVYNWESKGWVPWFKSFAGQGVYFPYTHIFATSGYTTAQIIANHLSNAIAARLDIAFVLVGGNDIADSGTSVATTIANLKQIYDDLMDAGAVVIAAPITPRTNSMDATTKAKKAAVNDFIYQYGLTKSRLIVARTNRYLIDATSSTGDQRSGILQSDNLHLSTLGAYEEAKEFYNAALPYLPPTDVRILDATDVYDSTHNLRGSLITNGLLNGTGGSVTGTGNSGTVADSWTFENITGTGSRGDLTAVCSKVASTDGENAEWQQIVLSGTPTATYVYFLRPSSAISTNFTAGVDRVYENFEYEVDYGATGLLQVGCSFTDGTFTSRDPVYSFNTSEGDYPGSEVIKGVRQTEPFLITSGAITINPRVAITVRGNVAVSATIRIRRIEARKVVSI